MPSAFDAGAQPWLARLGNQRNVVRQTVVARQLAGHVSDDPPLRVLDAGCGQGTQAVLLARRGHDVTGVDTSPKMQGAFAAAADGEPADVRARLRVVPGDVSDLGAAVGDASFELVLCHGVLMYLPQLQPALGSLAERTRAGGLVSVLVRNGDALAMRPGLRGQWQAALWALDATGYRNGLGLSARADTFAGVHTELHQAGLDLVAWYGVRVLSDAAPVETPAPPDPEELAALLDAEEQAGRRDPYRRVAALLHVLARRR